MVGKRSLRRRRSLLHERKCRRILGLLSDDGFDQRFRSEMIPGAGTEENITKQTYPGLLNCSPRINQNMKYQKPHYCGIWYFFIPYIHICGYVMDIVSIVCWHYNRSYLKGPEIRGYSSVLVRIYREGALKSDSVLIVIRRNVTGYTPVCI